VGSSGIIAQVALPVALTKLLAYEVPAELADRLRPGHRVKVPLRGRQAHGFVLACGPGEVPPGPQASTKP